MGNTRDRFKKIRDTKGTFRAKMGTIKDKTGMELTKAEDIKKRWQGVVLRWWRNGMGRPFSPTNSSKDHLNAEQIPQNNF